MTPAWLRPRAEADLIERTRYDVEHAGDEIAACFFDSSVVALRAIERMPGTGSPRIGELCEIPGLRVRHIAGFSCGWFYFVTPDHFDVVRLLADSQDDTAILEAFGDE